MQEVPSENPTTYCRLCFSDRNLIELFPKNGVPHHTLLEQISQCVGIYLKPIECVLGSVCWRCAITLEDFQSFRKRCLKHDAVLRLRQPKSYANNNEEEGSDSNDFAQHNDKDDTPAKEPKPAFDLMQFVADNRATMDEIFNSKSQSSNCDICGLELSSRSALSTHIKEQHSDNNRPHKCHLCKAAFKRKHHLEEHISSHLGVTKFTCENCGSCYDKHKSLMRHRRMHHSAPTRRQQRPIPALKQGNLFICPHCPKTFKHRPSLNFHAKSHYDLLSNACDVCDARFTNPRGVLVHKGKYHSEEVNSKQNEGPKQIFQCVQCPRFFERRGYLTQHIKFLHPVEQIQDTKDESNELDEKQTDGSDDYEEMESVPIKVEVDDTFFDME